MLGFATALGATAVVYPLLALEVGFSPATIGVFTAVSAAAQLLTRLALPWLLTRVPDRSLIGAAAGLIALSAGVLLGSTALVAFLGAQIAQGGARALFWTASLTHAVRASGPPVRRLAQVQIASNTGTLAGPALAGSIAAVSFPAALGLTVGGALAAAGAAMFMVRREPYGREARAQRKGLWWRPELALGYWTSFTSGGWRGMLDSFVPVILSRGGLGASVIGWLISTTEGAQLLVGIWLSRSKTERLHLLIRVGAGIVLLCVVALPLAAGNVVLAALVLALAGWGAGMANTLGPAITNSRARPVEQGAALAVTGAYRATARMATPSAVAAAGPLIGIPVAMGLAAAVMVTPVLVLSRRATTVS